MKQQARRRLRPPRHPRRRPLTTVGHATPRIDAVERVTGKATYTGDVQLPGMLYARVLRSPHPHARIRRIDVSKARALPGVKAVLTHENCTVVWGAGSIAGGAQYSDEIKKITKQRRYAFNNPVRFVGEPVAAVAAIDRHVAEEALQLIAVDYEVLPFVLDPEEALKPDAPQIWPEGNLSLERPQRDRSRTAQTRGNVEEASRRRDHVFEDRYSTAFVHNAQMEPRVVASRAGRATSSPSTRRPAASPTAAPTWRAISASRTEKVRVVCQYMGGNFGNKNQNQDADLIAAMLAKEAGAPVKLELSRKEDFIGMHGRWPTAQYYKVGVKQRRHAAGDSAARLQRHGPVPQELRRDCRRRALSVREHRDHDLARSTRTRRCRGTSAAPSFRRASSASSR